MRAAVLQGSRLELQELPDPVPNRGEILVAPIATGICGSDLHLREAMRGLENATAAEDWGGLPQFVPGHEFCAEVVETGAGVSAPFAAGQRVAAVPFTHGPAGPETIGLSPTRSGGLAELTVVDAVRTVPVPAELPSRLAALTEPLAVGLHAANLASRNEGPNVVIGCGPVGLAVILALRAAGRGPILAADLSPARRRAAELLGADIIVDPAENSPYQRWDDLSFSAEPPSPLLLASELREQPAGTNLFECVGAPGVLDQVISGAPQHSHIVVVGVCSHEDKIVPVQAITRELTIEFSFAYRLDEFRDSLAMVATHPDRAAALITSELGLADTAMAFDELAHEPQQIKVLIDPRR